jgi:Zinc carboxypeptidase
MPPAPPIPNRPNMAAYHYHTYDYAVPAPGPFAPSANIPGRGQFYSLVEDLEALRQNGVIRNVPNIAVVPVPGGAQTAGLRDTLMVSFGNVTNAANRPTVVFTGGIHAREWIAAEFAYLLAEYLIGNYPVGVPANPRLALLKYLVDNRNIRIIPMLNPDGNNRTVYGGAPADRYWRKNTRQLPATAGGWQATLAPGGMVTLPFRNVNVIGVPPAARYQGPDFDPLNGHPPNLLGANFRTQVMAVNEIGVDGNRNMATPGWGYDSAPSYDDKDPQQETYFGTSAGGEPENANLQLAMAAAPPGGWLGNIAVSIDYHSYGQMILYPDEMPPGGPDADYQRTGQLMQALIRNNIGLGYYTLGGVGVGYLSTGTIDSYSANTHQARAFTIELDPTGALGNAGFALGDIHIQDVFEKNIRGALAALAAPDGQPAAQAIRTALAPWAVHGAGNQVP